MGTFVTLIVTFYWIRNGQSPASDNLLLSAMPDTDRLKQFYEDSKCI